MRRSATHVRVGREITDVAQYVIRPNSPGGCFRGIEASILGLECWPCGDTSDGADSGDDECTERSFG
jgi:hypothetical protein